MKKLFLLMAMALPVCLFTACSSDDDEDGKGNPGDSMSSSVTEFKGSDGKTVRLSSDYAYSYNYDERGNLIGINSPHVAYQVSNNPFKVSGDNGEVKTTITADFNSKGYFSKVKSVASLQANYDEFEEKIDEVLYFSYDNDGHLTKITGTTKVTGKEYEEIFSYTGSNSSIYTWKNGLLTEIKIESKLTDGVETYIESETITCTYEENYPNECLQYTYSQENDGTILGMFQRLGFCGKGSLKLPSSVNTVTTYTDNGELGYQYENTNTFSYTYNTNGTVKTEKFGYNGEYSTYNYTYTNEVAEDEPLPHNLPMAKAAKQTSSLRPLFFSKRLHRNRQK